MHLAEWKDDDWTPIFPSLPPLSKKVIEILNQRTIYHLPHLIYHPCIHPRLPHGKLFGLLMEFFANYAKTRREICGTVFVLSDQANPPEPDSSLELLRQYAYDPKKCPISWRYASLTQCLLDLCGTKHSFFSETDYKYYLATKAWKSCETDKPLEHMLTWPSFVLPSIPCCRRFDCACMDLTGIPIAHISVINRKKRKGGRPLKVAD